MQNGDNDNTRFDEPVVIAITDVFDLHTIPPREVKAVVDEYLRQAPRERILRCANHRRRGSRRTAQCGSCHFIANAVCFGLDRRATRTRRPGCNHRSVATMELTQLERRKLQTYSLLSSRAGDRPTQLNSLASLDSVA